MASVASEAEGGPGMAVVVVLVVGEVGNGRAGPLMLQKRGSRLRPTHLGRPCCPIFVVLFSTFWDNWSRSRWVYLVLMQFERVHLEVFSTSCFAPSALSSDWNTQIQLSPIHKPTKCDTQTNRHSFRNCSFFMTHMGPLLTLLRK